MNTHQRRRHRVDSMNCIEVEIQKIRNPRTEEKDMAMWRDSSGKFKKKFTSKETWKEIRHVHHVADWYKGLWFKHATPKFAFLAWLALLYRLSTADRMVTWSSNISTVCVLCSHDDESRNHLFFKCIYTSEIWKNLAYRLLGDYYTT